MNIEILYITGYCLLLIHLVANTEVGKGVLTEVKLLLARKVMYLYLEEDGNTAWGILVFGG